MRVNPKVSRKLNQFKPLRQRKWFGKRTFAYCELLDASDELGYENKLIERDVYQVNSNLVSSETKGGLHLPTLDIDLPAKLVKSRTKGHYHLYLNPSKPLTWKKYKKLLRVLAECGLVEEGYVNASIDRGASYVRKPYVPAHIEEPF